MSDRQAEPRSVAPLDVPMSTITTAGTGLWGLGLVVTTIAWGTGHLPVVAPATCAFGVMVGLVVLRWLRARSRREAAGPAPQVGPVG